VQTSWKGEEVAGAHDSTASISISQPVRWPDMVARPKCPCDLVNDCSDVLLAHGGPKKVNIVEDFVDPSELGDRGMENADLSFLIPMEDKGGASTVYFQVTWSV
jgi:hypothetical protein